MAGCDTWDWIKCGGVVATCGAACVSGVASLGCVSCLGGAYGQCKDCIGLQAAVQIARQEQSELMK